MRRKTFHKTLLMCAVLVFISYAEASTSWLPARVLAMVYPWDARAARIEGDVQASCSLRSDGSVADVVIISGHPVLARSVRTNLLRWIFRRADSGGGPLKQVKVTFSFQLKGNCIRSNKCKEESWYEYPDHIIVVSEMPPLNTGVQKVPGN